MNSDNKSSFIKFLAVIPLPLIILLTVILIGGGALLLIYSFVIVAAWKSAMAFLVIFGGGAIALGAGLTAIEGFKRYIAFYDKKFKDRIEKPKTEIVKKKIFTLSNVALGILLLGSLLAIISSPLGSIERGKWLDAKAAYMEENGYYNETQTFEFEFPVYEPTQTANSGNEAGVSAALPAKINKILLNLKDKNAAVIYDDSYSAVNIKIKYYVAYKNQVSFSVSGHTLSLAETPSPRLNRVKDKMLFFLFNDNKIERQIKIIIPAKYRDAVEIKGNFIVAK